MPKIIHLWPYAAAPLGGALLALCYPPHDQSAFIWAFLIPFLAALWLPAKSPKRPALRGTLLGYLFGLAFFTINLSWISAVHPAAITIVFYLSLYPAAFGAFAATIGRPRDQQLCPTSNTGTPAREAAAPRNTGTPARAAAAPRNTGTPAREAAAPSKWDTTFSTAWPSIRVALLNAAMWTGLEYLRGVLFTGFGWNGLGVAFHQDLLILAQAADIIGVTGLSFMVVFVGTIFAATLRRLQLEIRSLSMRPHLDFGAAILLIIAFFFYGIAKTNQKPPADPLELDTLLVQANIPQEDKWDEAYAKEIYHTYNWLTLPNVSAAPLDLVIWPETALPQEYYFNYANHQKFLNKLLAERDFSLVFGTNENAIGEGYFNSIMTMRGNTDSMQSYRKVHLVPFGEFVPFRGKIKLLNFLEDLVLSDFIAGTNTEPLQLSTPEPYSVIPTICFEDTIGRLARKFVRNEPQLIINCTNDGWFGETVCSLQHMANAKFRCIELRRPMARAANTGVTCIIDATGSLDDRRQPGYDPRILTDSETDSTFMQGSMREKIALDRNPPTTFYAKHGDVFSILCGVVSLGVILSALVRRRESSD